MTVAREKGYAPIGAYGLIGNGAGSALVCQDGRIDWLAAPRIDTLPFLAAIIDASDGGYFAAGPAGGDYQVTRRYQDGTMVLQTTFETADGRLVITDAFTHGFEGRLPWTELARRIEAPDGPVRLAWELRPGTRLDQARPFVHHRGETPLILSGALLAAVIHQGVDGNEVDGEAVGGQAVIEPGRPALLALVLAEDKPLRLPRPDDVLRRLEHACQEWRAWSDRIGYRGPHRQQIMRSALTIKALSDRQTGALAAAPTTSLPEAVGKARNFDYRFAWVRDSSFMIDALTRLGLSEQVDASLAWLLQAVQRTAPAVHVLYTLDGRPAPGDQQRLDLVDGYLGSAPVIIGNKAASQAQHGSYGDLCGAVARYVDGGGHLDTETGLVLAKLADQLCDEWPRPDAGLWELGDYQRYTSSLINSWTALDRVVRLARKDQVPFIHLERWEHARQAIHDYADSHCWSEAKKSYTFYAGTERLDAAVLLAARTGFLSGDDPRLWATIDAIRSELTAEGPLVYRYSGAGEEENAFAACTFWLIEALCYAGRTDEAGELLDGALRYSNDLDLWSEEIQPTTGHLRGNFPIGISHLSVITAITAYAAALEHGATPPPD